MYSTLDTFSMVLSRISHVKALNFQARERKRFKGNLCPKLHLKNTSIRFKEIFHKLSTQALGVASSHLKNTMICHDLHKHNCYTEKITQQECKMERKKEVSETKDTSTQRVTHL
jgi:hypothetical protein